MTWAATVLTLYPEMFPGPLGVSLAGRALGEGTWSLETVQIRDFAADKHRTVDDSLRLNEDVLMREHVLDPMGIAANWHADKVIVEEGVDPRV